MTPEQLFQFIKITNDNLLFKTAECIKEVHKIGHTAYINICSATSTPLSAVNNWTFLDWALFAIFSLIGITILIIIGGGLFNFIKNK